MSEVRRDRGTENRVGPPQSTRPRGGPGPGGGRGPGGFRMGMPVEKPKDFKGTLRRLVVYLKPRRLQILAVFFMAILSNIFLILSPRVMGRATTELFQTTMARLQGVNVPIDFGLIQQILLTLAVLYILSAFFSYLQHFIMAGIAQKTVYDMRSDINDKLARLPLKYFDARTHGETLSRAVNDVDNVSNTLQQSLTQLISAVVTLVGVVIMMLLISPALTLISMVTLPLYVVATRAITKRSRKYFAEQQKVLGELNGHVEEMYTGHRIVKAFGQEHASLEQFGTINERLYNAGWRAQFISGIVMPLMIVINNISYILVCVVGGIFVTRQTIQVGDIQAFIQYSRQFTRPIQETASIANILQSTIASAERVFELLDEEEEIADIDKQCIDQPKGDVAFKNVTFGYNKGVIVIDKMNIDVKSGQTVAIVGPTGAGKTTLVNLLMRFYEIDAGKITIDGVDIKDVKRGHLRSLFGMVLQDAWLFNGTLRENIAYGREGATEDEVVGAAQAAHVDHFIRTLPNGYDTILNEEASNISQGQKQLMTIARAVLADPAILILDEATSSVDTRTEALIQKAMTELMQGRTSFVIAHRLSTIRDAQCILVMNEGVIVEKGTHDELLAQEGFYADLYNSQFAIEADVKQMAMGS